MLRTATSFRVNRVPTHSLRHQTSATFAGFLLKRQQNIPLSCSSLLVAGKPWRVDYRVQWISAAQGWNVWLLFHGNAIKVHRCLACQCVIVIIKSWQGNKRNWALQTAFGNRLVRASPRGASFWKWVVSCVVFSIEWVRVRVVFGFISPWPETYRAWSHLPEFHGGKLNVSDI